MVLATHGSYEFKAENCKNIPFLDVSYTLPPFVQYSNKKRNLKTMISISDSGLTLNLMERAECTTTMETSTRDTGIAGKEMGMGDMSTLMEVFMYFTHGI
jgi:MORN repeat